jgi:hypothetical protein
VKGDKEAIPDAQLQNDFGDLHVEKANTRLPYVSYAQGDEPAKPTWKVKGEKEW